jgi:tRNA threonylcarbamoyladenosine biosynthesis protein TsaE
MKHRWLFNCLFSPISLSVIRPSWRTSGSTVVSFMLPGLSSRSIVPFSTLTPFHPCEQFVETIKSDEALEAFGARLASILHRGDVVFMRGDLGAGKTTISRGFVRNKLNDDEMVVTSPSYLLDNTYQYMTSRHDHSVEEHERNQDIGNCNMDGEVVETIHHIDLYRLEEGFNSGLLDIPSIYDTSLCLIEWPERLAMADYPARYIDVELKIDDSEARIVTLSVYGEWSERKRNQLKGIME